MSFMAIHKSNLTNDGERVAVHGEDVEELMYELTTREEDLQDWEVWANDYAAQRKLVFMCEYTSRHADGSPIECETELDWPGRCDRHQ